VHFAAMPRDAIEPTSFADVADAIAVNVPPLRTARTLSLASVGAPAPRPQATPPNLAHPPGPPPPQPLSSRAAALRAPIPDLRAGDYARYPADRPHVYRATDEYCRGILLVGYPPA